MVVRIAIWRFKTYMFPWDVNAVYNSDINTVTIHLPWERYGILICLLMVPASVGLLLARNGSQYRSFGIQFDEMGVYNPVVYPATYLDFLSCLKNDAVASGLYPNQTLGEMFADRVGMEQ